MHLHRVMLGVLASAMLFCGSLARAADAPPNILFVIADDWGPHAGVYGTPWVKTPSIDRLAREGLRFNYAFTPCAKCASSRAVILTGRQPWQNEEAANHQSYFPAKFKTWPEALMEKGWHVGVTGKGWGPGVDNDANGKPRQMTGKPYNKRKTDPPADGMAKNDYAANFVDFLKAAPAGKPWCFWYGCQEPHREYELGSGVAKGGKKLSDIDRVPGYWPDNDTVRGDMLDYAYEVEHFDSHLGRMIAELEKRKLLDNTLVVVTSDHGMPFPRVKGYAYFDSNHVPLIVRWPGGIKAPGRVVDDFVNFADMAPTLLDAVGIAQDATGMAPIAGKSWRPIFESEKSGRIVPERDHVILCKERNDLGRPHDEGYPIRSIVTAKYAYLRNYEPSRWPAGNPETGYLDTDSSPTKTAILALGRKDRSDKFWRLGFGMRPADELYDRANDPDCVQNLAADSAHAERVKTLRDQLEAELKAAQDPRMAGKGNVFDEYLHVRGRDFYGRVLRKEIPGLALPIDYDKPLDPKTYEPLPAEGVGARSKQRKE